MATTIPSALPSLPDRCGRGGEIGLRRRVDLGGAREAFTVRSGDGELGWVRRRQRTCGPDWWVKVVKD